MPRIGILASGAGSNLQALIDADLGPKATLVLVIVNVPGARALDRAVRAQIPALLIDHTAYPDRRAFDGALVEALRAHQVDWVVLAGFMRLLGPVMLEAFPDRIVNIHPSLLPAFPGTASQKRALEAGVKVTGCTAHLVDQGTDTGPILGQIAVPVLTDDDEPRLRARILRQEHRLLPAVVRAVAEGRLRIEGRRAFLDGFSGSDQELLACPELEAARSTVPTGRKDGP